MAAHEELGTGRVGPGRLHGLDERLAPCGLVVETRHVHHTGLPAALAQLGDLRPRLFEAGAGTGVYLHGVAGEQHHGVASGLLQLLQPGGDAWVAVAHGEHHAGARLTAQAQGLLQVRRLGLARNHEGGAFRRPELAVVVHRALRARLADVLHEGLANEVRCADDGGVHEELAQITRDGLNGGLVCGTGVHKQDAELHDECIPSWTVTDVSSVANPRPRFCHGSIAFSQGVTAWARDRVPDKRERQ